MENRIALQLFTLRDFLKTEADIGKTLARVSETGYRAVELASLGPIDDKNLKDLLDQNRLECMGMHIGLPALQQDLEGLVKKMKTLKCPFAAIGGPPKEYRNREGFVKLAKEMEDFGKKFADRGLRLGYHNHRFEFEKWFDKTAYEYLFDNTRHVWAELDCYWVQYGGADSAALIRKLKGRIAEVHLKDMTVRNDQPIMAEVGEGNIHWPGVIKACEESGVKRFVVEQDLCERDPFESIRISLNNLQKWGLK